MTTIYDFRAGLWAVYLANNGWSSASDMARFFDIPARNIQKVMRKLELRGFVVSQRTATEGSRFIRKVYNIKALGDAVREEHRATNNEAVMGYLQQAGVPETCYDVCKTTGLSVCVARNCLTRLAEAGLVAVHERQLCADGYVRSMYSLTQKGRDINIDEVNNACYSRRAS